MAGQYEIFEHTADVGIDARGDTLGELYQALGEGLAGLICQADRVQPREKRTLAVQAEDAEALAVDFLSALLNVIQVDRFAVAQVRVTGADQTALEVELAGEPLDPDRHEIDTEIKAVTYHRLKVARDRQGWSGRVIFDI